ncbi:MULTISPECIES: TasA family protein [unclassified Virgibacillus]|uniref:TasA family protein n=1 Tax=unclassified Virgibacillus TaxID=2620237 RepID=UPI0024DE3AE6|nr:TasA family protein [Virgibacillus sp. LDC-1]
MSMKKKMTTGILAGALGLSLVAGGTYAAFNDVETVDNSFAAGTLDLETNTDVLFDLSNLKPGDWFEKTLTLTNNGSLAIDEILLTSFASGWEDVLHNQLPDDGVNNEVDFLRQFQVEVMGETFTLDELVAHANQSVTFEGAGVASLEPGDSHDFDVKITFVEDDTRYDGSRFFEQNKYQGEGAAINLRFEATQMPGEDRSND